MSYLGVASAIHGFEKTKLTTTILEGSTKHGIQIQQIESVPVDVHSVNDVRTKIRGLLSTVGRVIVGQRNRGPYRIKVPFIFGMPATAETGAFLGNLSQGFKTSYPDELRVPAPNSLAQSQCDLAAMSHIFSGEMSRERGNPILDQHYLMESRVFIDSDSRNTQASTVEALAGYSTGAAAAWVVEFEALRAQGPSGREKLKAMVRTRALESVADSITLRRGVESEGVRQPRFFLLGPLQGAQDIAYFNYFKDDEELRQLLGAQFIQYLNLQQNISVKCPADVPSPPFADVAATYMADQMDLIERRRIEPCVVRAKRK